MKTPSRRIQLELRGPEPIVGKRMSIWDWNVEAELGKIVPVTGTNSGDFGAVSRQGSEQSALSDLALSEAFR